MLKENSIVDDDSILSMTMYVIDRYLLNMTMKDLLINCHY